MKTVLITGVSTGIGRATAVTLLRAGWRVYGSVRKPGDAAELQKDHPAAFHELIFDVTDAAARATAIAEIEANGHQLCALVNNAGIAVSGPLETLPEADLRRQFDVNVFGLLGVTQCCLPQLHASKAAGLGPIRIVNVSSVSGILTSPFTSLYSASKFAVESLTDGLRRELFSFGIDVVSVAPGPVKTPIWQKAVVRTEPFTGSRYEFVLEKLPAYIANAEASAIPAEEVAAVIFQALSRDKTRPHHLVMPRSWLIRLISRLPKRTMDKMAWKRLMANRRY